MQEATMLYRSPGEHSIHGHSVEFVVVDAHEVPDHLGDGWFLTPTEAGEAVQPKDEDKADDTAPPTRAELEQKARELGIPFDGRTADKTLAAKIEAKLKA